MFLYRKTLIPAEVNGAWVAARQNGSISGQGANLWPADFFGENTTFYSLSEKSFYGHSIEATKNID